MVGVVEGVLVVGAIGLDVYAYKKMKDAEDAAENAVRLRERDRFKSHVSDTSTTIHVNETPQASGTTLPAAAPLGEQTTLHEHHEPTGDTTHEHSTTEWKGVTYSSVSPVQHVDAEEKDESEESATHTTKISLADSPEWDELKVQYRTIAERLDVIDERLSEQDTKISVMDTKFTHLDEELEKTTVHLKETSQTALPEEAIATIVGKQIGKSNERILAQLKEHGKKLQEIQTKLDHHIISTPETALIKKDLREEFQPLFADARKYSETQHLETQSALKALSKRITQAKADALSEVQAAKVQARKSVSALKLKAASKPKVIVKKVATKTAAKNPKAISTLTTKTTSTKTVKKTTKTAKKAAAKSTTKAVKKVAPKSAIQKAVSDYAHRRSSSDVTVTTTVPKGVDVSTEVVSKK